MQSIRTTAFAAAVWMLAGSCLATDFESAAEFYRRQDYPKAFEAFSALADAGDPRAQAVLAIMYKYGESVPLDQSMSFHWYLKAAERGYPPAQFQVGQMLARGIGTAEDMDTARQWLQKAEQAGYERASDLLAEIDGTRTASATAAEPVAWSKRWNLRLPNAIRFEDETELAGIYRVYRVQLGAMSSINAAQRLWDQIRDRSNGVLDDYQPIFREVQADQQRIYRIQVGPF